MKILNELLIVASILVIGVLIGLSYYQNKILKEYRNLIELYETAKQDTITKTDTLYKTISMIDTVPLYKTKTIIKTDTLYKDSVPFTVTLEQKQFDNTIISKGDTTHYQAYIKGYSINNDSFPALDSIKLHTSHKIIYTDRVITKTVKVPQNVRKWHLSPSVGFGYGFINKKPDVYVGITLGYDI